MPGLISRRSRKMDPSSRDEEGNPGLFFELWQELWCSSRGETAMSGNFLSCLKSVKKHFEPKEGRWDFSRDAAVEKGLTSR